MTPEQKYLIEKIRERTERLKIGREPTGESDVDRVYENTINDLLGDVQFLLSIVKGQEADYLLVDSYLAELKQELGLPPNAHASISLERYKERIATSMRSLCVEKVKDWLGKAGFDYGPLVRELELLTLREQEK